MGFIPEHIEGYLAEHFYPEMSGKDLAEKISIPGRSARRYLRYYREKLNKLSSPVSLNVQPMFLNGCVFDIETTDFGTEGYAGYLICCSFADLHSDKVETLEIRYDDYRNDRRLIVEVARKLSQYALHVGHNIAAYDYNWLNTRLRYHRLPTLDSAFYFDTYQVPKAMGLKTTKSLGNLIDYFGLEGVKTTIYRTSWSMVNSSVETEFDDALDEISEHCQFDVLANKELFHQVILPYCMTRGGTNPLKMSKERGNYWRYN